MNKIFLLPIVSGHFSIKREKAILIDCVKQMFDFRVKINDEKN